MKRRNLYSVLSMVLIAALVCFMGNAKITKAEDSGDEFIKGMDLSSLEALEDNGVVFYDENNNEITDILSYLAEDKGVNYVRLRVWNNPTTSFDAGDYCNPAHTVEMAQRIKAAGLKLLIDFHYSDTWADPSYQTKPAAWEDLSFSELVTAVYDYTSDVLNDLNAAGAYPDMVQIGNEISGGMLWPDGYIDNLDNLAALLNSGISAVRDTTPAGKYTKIMIHLAEGGDMERFQYFFDSMESRGVTDYDVIGMSYYSYWHGTLQDVKDNMNFVSARYDKDVVIAETAYPYTYSDADDEENLIGQVQTDEVGLDASVAHQKAMIEATFNTVANVDNGHGLGAFYWEPLWVACDGVGVTQGAGNEWDNQTVFDAGDKALNSLNAFLFDADTAAVNNDKDLIVYSPDALKMQVNAYSSVSAVAPTTVEVQQFDGDIVSLPVTWSGISSIDTSKIGTYELTGTVSGLSAYTGVTLKNPVLKVVIQKNVASDSSFEIMTSSTPWKINKITGSAGQITNGSDSTPYSGTGSFQYWDDEAFCTEVYQTVTVTAGKTYKLNALYQGLSANVDSANSYFFARYTSGSKTTYLGTAAISNTYYKDWHEAAISTITIPKGVTKLVIGARITGTSGGYGTIDDLELLDTTN